MELKIYQIDAFASALFQGNPAAVCILEEWLPEMLMQAIAMEMNLSETAFLVKKDDGYRIRWFTPNREVKLCGHATLAAAHVLFRHEQIASQVIRFSSLSGTLVAHMTPEGLISLDFPSNPVKHTALTSEIHLALGGSPESALAGEDLIVTYNDATEIEILTPNMSMLEKLPYRGICVTAPGNGYHYDFVSRFFAPAYGIPEDPVTGSSFTQLAPYYAERLDKTQFFAKQLSKRGGEVNVTLAGSRVHIAGTAKTFMIGNMLLDH
ncbi:MAG: PhzF family phenazine biosynthesis protein [Agarilytica sp.]